MQEHHASASASAANVVCPNVLELGIMTGTDPRNPAEVLSATLTLTLTLTLPVPLTLTLTLTTNPDPNPNPNRNQVLSAARQLLDKGPRLVLVKHLAHAGLDPDKAFEMRL